MMDQLANLVHQVPYVLQSRASGNHWLELAVGGFFVAYAFISIFIGSIWSAGHVGSVTPDERPLAFWSCVMAYATAGIWLAMYM